MFFMIRDGFLENTQMEKYASKIGIRTPFTISITEVFDESEMKMVVLNCV